MANRSDRELAKSAECLWHQASKAEWNPARGYHQGQRSRPHQQAGHKTAPDQCQTSNRHLQRGSHPQRTLGECPFCVEADASGQWHMRSSGTLPQPRSACPALLLERPHCCWATASKIGAVREGPVLSGETELKLLRNAFACRRPQANAGKPSI